MSDEVLRQGSNGDDITELQTHLYQLNFYAGTIDGYFGPTTEEAVTAYREWSGAGYGTEIDQELRAALTGHAEQYAQQDSAETAVDVTDLQTHLQQLNFYAGSLDGHLGSTTEAAITAYREWSGLGPGTEIDDQLRTTLAAHAAQYANPGTDAAATATEPKAIPAVANDEIDDADTEEAPAPDLEEAVL